MSISESKDVEETLGKPGVHNQWEKDFRSEENEKSYEEIFDFIANVLNAPDKSTILDVGCGPGFHSMRLAKRNFSVIAADFSESALKMAEKNLQSHNLQDKVTLQRENILSLSFPDESFDFILCWGVLMHIPDIEKAISELARISKKGGIIVVSEVNMFSFDSIMLRSVQRMLRKEKADVKRTAAGLEYWDITPSGKLITRKSDIRWLKYKFKSSGFTVCKHISGQFTEMYGRVFSRPVLRFIHGLNRLWFKYIKIPGLANGNIIFFQKKI